MLPKLHQNTEIKRFEKKIMKLLLFGTLLGFFVTSCSAQDLSSYTNIHSTESLKKSTQKNFEITQINDYFYVTNNENEKQIIAFFLGHLYKFDQSGNLIDTLKLPDYGAIMYNIQPENYFIYFEDGYLPNWIKTGDKTKHQYNKVYNKDLTMDLDAVKQYKKDKLNFEYKDPNKPLKEYYDYLEKKAENIELIKLLKTLSNQSKYRQKVYFSTAYVSNIFMTNNEIIKVNIPYELEYNSNKITGEKRLETVIPLFNEEQKPFHFEKKEWAKRNWNILSTNHGGYWLGDAYYKLPIGKSTLKMKVESIVKKEKNNIRIRRNIFPYNKNFVLIETRHGNYFIKEK